PAAPAQLLLGLALDLPDPLAREPERLPDLLERPRLLPVEAEAHPDDLPLLLLELGHHHLDLLLEGVLDHLELDGRDRVLLEGVAELDAAVLADRGGEREVVARRPQQQLDLLGGELGLLRELLGRGRPLELDREAVARLLELRDLPRELLGQAEDPR